MKIAFDARLTYYRQGGISEYMRRLLEAFVPFAPDHDLRVLHNFRMKETLSPVFPRLNCLTPCHHRYERTLLGLELSPHRFDLLHSPDFIPPRWGARRYVITVHDLAFLLFENLQTAASLRYYRDQLASSLAQASQVITVSHATKADLLRLFDVPENRITVIWNGVHPRFQPLDPVTIESHLSAYPQLPREYLLFVGTIEPRKNLPTLLKAYHQLRDAPKLVLAGQKGWLSEETFQTIADLELQDAVILLSEIASEHLPALYNRALIHLFPSIYEGFGLPVLEAMACGTPTISSDRGSLPEVIGSAGLMVDPENVDAIADAIQQLLTDRALADRLRADGLVWVKQFTWEQCARQTLGVYATALG
ncbi:MAG: glycosyltransferase family 4 protein [Anaerolineae bacterium]|jgi:glycosyltransferase involved in cell wall biosynthesis|nr:glycosyltransferase family 4 protein [Anaerolineae bacterium]